MTETDLLQTLARGEDSRHQFSAVVRRPKPEWVIAAGELTPPVAPPVTPPVAGVVTGEVTPEVAPEVTPEVARLLSMHAAKGRTAQDVIRKNDE